MNPHRLILIKHSLPAIDPAQPAHTWILSAEGEARCAIFAAHLQPYKLNEIITSLEPKAQRTGQLLAQVLALPWRSLPDLHEHDRRNEPYRSSPDEFQQQVGNFFARPQEAVFGSETASACLQRFSAAVDPLWAAAQQDLCLVAHGTVISLYCAARAGIDGFALWQQLSLPSMVVLQANNLERIELF